MMDMPMPKMPKHPPMEMRTKMPDPLELELGRRSKVQTVMEKHGMRERKMPFMGDKRAAY